VDPYRLDEVEEVWRRLAREDWVQVRPANGPYRLAALSIVASRARATERELNAYMAKHEWSSDVEEVRQVLSRLSNIRHAARAAHDALAMRVGRHVRPWPYENPG